MRHVEGVVVFPSTASASDPFIAIRTPSGQRLWLDLRRLRGGAPSLNAGDRIAAHGRTTTRVDVVIPDDVVRRSFATGLDPLPLPTADTLLGTWMGRWQAADGVYGGAAELVATGVAGRDGSVVGQFTFVSGAVSRSLRYVGCLENGVVRFALPDEGRIAFEAGHDRRDGTAATRLFGSWADRRGCLPVEHGIFQLVRTSRPLTTG